MRDRHTYTQDDYCNPLCHARRGLINIYIPKIRIIHQTREARFRPPMNEIRVYITRRNAEHYGASVSEVADYIAAASHSSRATHAQTVSGALLRDSVAFVLARAGSGERCWRCSSLPQLFCAFWVFTYLCEFYLCCTGYSTQ